MRAAMRVAGLFGLLMFSSQLMAEYQLDMRPGVTSFSQGAHEIHTMVMWICVVIGIIVFGAMTWSIVHHRKSKGAVPAKFDDNLSVEILWTVVPFIILIVMAIPATKVLLEMEDVSNSDISIKVTGYQWKWQYEYLDGPAEDVSFFSVLTTPREQIEGTAEKGENYLLEVDNPIVVPINKKIRFLVTSNDVIHSWWVPALGWKQDAVPGFINDAWTLLSEPGTYRGNCAELCGKDHGFMPIVLVAKTEEDYQAWVKEQQGAAAAEAAAAQKTWTTDDLMARGKEVYTTNCLACHQAGGEGIPAAGFPALTGGKIATGPVAEHIDIIINGSKVNPAMAAFGPQLSDVDIAAVVTYERNALGNSVGDVVQPSDIAAAR